MYTLHKVIQMLIYKHLYIILQLYLTENLFYDFIYKLELTKVGNTFVK